MWGAYKTDPVHPVNRRCSKCGRFGVTERIIDDSVITICDNCNLETKAESGTLGVHTGTEKWARRIEQNRTMKTEQVSQGQFCQNCNAWRGSLGLEPTPELYIQHMVQIFAEIKRVLRKDGTVWLNLGDSYASQGGPLKEGGGINDILGGPSETQDYNRSRKAPVGLKPKDLCGIPWRVALALQADGWWLRSDIIWNKPNPMPESVTDRPTRSHEYIFLLTKSAKYYFDNDAIREPHKEPWRSGKKESTTPHSGRLDDPNKEQAAFTVAQREYNPLGRNKRSVWTITTQSFPEAHFATFPEEIPKTCILAGTSEKGCCPECLAPWVRVVEKKTSTPGQAQGYTRDCTMRNDGERAGSFTDMESKPIGWKPTCNCPGLDGDSPGSDCADMNNWPVIPCTVLDPFSGSGKTLIVAKKLRRKAIGIELNPDYARMGVKYLNQEVLQFGR